MQTLIYNYMMFADVYETFETLTTVPALAPQ